MRQVHREENRVEHNGGLTMANDINSVMDDLERCTHPAPFTSCKECTHKGSPDDCPHCFERLAADALELLKERRWIPVTERLPREMTNKVLVYLQHEDYVGYIGYGHYEKFHGEEMWYDLEHGEQFAKRGYIVTHWMPSPQPPKEG